MTPASSEEPVWRVLLAYMRPHRWQFALVAVCALLATGTELLSPLIYRAAVNDIAGLFVGEVGSRGIDTLSRRGSAAEDEEEVVPEAHRHGKVGARTPAQTFHTLMWAVTLLFLIGMLSHAFGLVADQHTAVLSSRIEADVIQRTFAHVLRLPLQFFARHSSGGLAKQIDQLDQVSPIVTAFAHQIAPEMIRMIGVLAIMVTQSWRLTLVAITTLPAYLWIVGRSSVRLEAGLGRYYEMWESVSARIQEALGAIKTVKLSGAEMRESARLRNESVAAYATYLERNRLANRYFFWQTALSNASQTLVLGYGGWLVLERQLTPGDVVMFVVYLDKLFAPIESLTEAGVGLQENFASLRRALRLLATPGAESGGDALAPGPGRVTLRDVQFSYVPGREVLKGVSFELPAGRVTAIVGPSGAGKTTLSDLLLRLFEPQGGEILIDGQRISDVEAAALRREIGVVAADGAIFRGSLADNIRYKRPDSEDTEVHAAALAAGLTRTLERLPEGLQTQIGERGVGLSVGERQRLQIARALVGRPRVLILDEATANLDYETEAEIRAALLQRPDRPTTLVIAHRYSMVESADQVVVLDAGQVLECGTVPELLATGGWFARFAAAAAQPAQSEPAPDAEQAEADDEIETNETEDEMAADDDAGVRRSTALGCPDRDP